MDVFSHSPLLLATGFGFTTVITFAILYRFLSSPYRLLSNHGIRGPTPFPLLGNFLSINKVGHDRFLEEQIKTFGKIFGYYVGSTPKVAITDVEIAKEIMVKEFENFSDRDSWWVLLRSH
jgi:hypothetical protein